MSTHEALELRSASCVAGGRPLVQYAPGILIAGSLAALYGRTLAPGLTWAFDGADAGDLITAAVTGGVPHPTGYPTYLAIASIFLRIPAGSFAFRTNLLSLIATVCAAWLLYLLVLRVDGRVAGASVAALAFGTAPLIWSQAIITEVYALQGLFTVGFLYWLLVGPAARRADWALGVTSGLMIGNHLTGALMLPLLLLRRSSYDDRISAVVASQERGFVAPPSALLRRLVGLSLGLSIYATIPLRALSQAPVNWGSIHDLQSFSWLVTGQMYWSRLADNSFGYLLSGFQAWARFVLEQFTVPGLLLLLVGLIVFFKPSRLYVATSWMVLAYSLFAIRYYSPDSYTLLTPAVIAFSIWIGLATNRLADQASRKIAYGAAMTFSLLLAFFVFRGALSTQRMDLSTDHKAEQFAQRILDAAPRHAIVLVQGDEPTFALWYLHYGNNERPDLAVVSNDLMEQPWYADVLRHTYRDLAVPDAPGARALSQANPGRSFCIVAPDIQQRLECTG